MKKVVRAVSLMLLMAGVCGNAFAEENENIVRQGTIRGRVIAVSYTHLTLPTNSRV
mgnify:CR=1 FL=1